MRRFAEAARGLESAQALKRSEVISTPPEYLHAVAAICRHGPTPERLATRARLEEPHINLRLRVGATQEDATDEYTLLGRLIPRLWEDTRPERKPDGADLQCLFQQREEAMDHVVLLFSGYSLEDRQREKRFMRQLDALAPQWLEPHADPQASLKPPVASIVRAMEATGAELLLVDAGGRRLVPVAQVPPPSRPVGGRAGAILPGPGGALGGAAEAGFRDVGARGAAALESGAAGGARRPLLRPFVDTACLRLGMPTHSTQGAGGTP